MRPWRFQQSSRQRTAAISPQAACRPQRGEGGGRLVGGELFWVFFFFLFSRGGGVCSSTYGNPVSPSGKHVCTGGRDGFEVHRAISSQPGRLHQVSGFPTAPVHAEIKALARARTAAAGWSRGMSLVEAPSAGVRQSRLCARRSDDPEFDRACFSPNGDRFRANPREARSIPGADGRRANTGLCGRARAGSGPPTTANSPR